MIFNLLVISLIIIIGLIFSDSRLVPWHEDIKRKRYIWIISLLLVLQSGLRNVAVGADTYAYYLTFEQIKHIEWSSVFNSFVKYYTGEGGKDPGYAIFQKVIQIFTSNYQVYLFLIAFLFFSALGNFIYKNTSKLWEVIFAFVLYSTLFYSFFSITGHRQTIATAATLFGFELIKNRRLLPFILLILFASTIHRSCLIFIPFYFLYNLKQSKILIPVALISFIILMIYRVPVSAALKSIGGYENYGIYEGAGTYTFTAMLLLVAIIMWWRMKFILYEIESSRPFINALIFAVVFTPLTWVNPSAMRVVQYYSIFLILLIPKILESFKYFNFKVRKIGYAMAIIGLIFLFAQAGLDMEYKFFWQDMDLGENYFR